MGVSLIDAQRDRRLNRDTFSMPSSIADRDLSHSECPSEYNSWRSTHVHVRCLWLFLLLIDLAKSSQQWKVLVLDESSRKLLDNVIKEDDILNENITRRSPFHTHAFILARLT